MTKILLISFLVVLFVLKVGKAQNVEYVIKVELDELKLYLLDRSHNVLKVYPVAGPKFRAYPRPLVGRVEKIEINPVWYPTEKTRADFLKKGKKLPKVVPPGPENPLGVAKLKIKWSNWDEPIMIHGTNEPQTIGKRVSRGCIRMTNEDILELSQLIKGKEVKVIIN